ncbi:hypothetical protein KDA00_03340 [Candidatus Saccharibacteria bacterium]|nr:hypothetical protein [Candidatus Saccharibacteria bacterium]
MSEVKVEIEIFDTTMRDGAQSLPAIHQFPADSKPIIADAIASLGVGVIEAGFPATPGDASEVNDVARSVGQSDYEVTVWNNGMSKTTVRPVVIAGLSRTVASDIEATWDAIEIAKRPRIHTFVSTDPTHMEAKFPNKSPDEVRAMGRQAVAFAHDISNGHSGASIEFSAEAATTTNTSYLEKVIRDAVAEGADVINVPDTVGQRSPFWMKDFYRQVINWVHSENPKVAVSAHNHNDLGNAVANSIALIQAGAEHSMYKNVDTRVQIESTVCGLGERAGNADVFPLIAGIFKFSEEMPANLVWEFNPFRSLCVAQSVMTAGGMNIDRQNPVVGSDINTHRSGIHSDGIIKGGHEIYTPFDPRFWGHGASAIHEEGKYQGKSGREAAMAYKT